MLKPEKRILLAAALVCMAPAFANSARAEVAASYSLVFESSDINGSSHISRAELAHLQESIFLQIDTDDDAFLAAEEWNNWDPGPTGVSYTPVEIGKIYAAMARLFVGFDLDHDARLDRAEMRAGLFGDFDLADAHHDGFLTGEEFAAAFLLPTLVAKDVTEMFGTTPVAAAPTIN